MNNLEEILNDYLNNLPEPKEFDKMKLISGLKNNINLITEIDFDIPFLKIIYEKNDVSKILDNLLFIQKIIYAKTKGINFELEAEQKKFLENFIELVDEKFTKELEKAKKYKEPYLKILAKLENKEIISEIDLILKMLNDKNISYEDRNKIILDLLKHNNTVYSNEHYIGSIKIVNTLTKEKLAELLTKYGYDINLISENNINFILNEANYDNILNVLNKLRSRAYNFIKEDDQLFSIILTLSNEEVLSNIETIASENSFHVKDLKSLSNVFIPKRNTKTRSNGYKKPQVVSGYENFIEIIDTLKMQGIEIDEAIKKCSFLFRTAPSKIKNNIKSYSLYGLKKNNKVGLSTYSWMNASNLMGVCDKFIELGMYSYIERYNSKLTLAPDDLSFYRIYYAQKQNIPYYHYTEGSNNTYCLKQEIFGGGNNSFGINDLDMAKLSCEATSIPKKTYIENILSKNPNNKINIAFTSKLLKQLEKYKKNNYVYDFDGRYISRLKVLRLAETIMQNGLDIDKDLLLYLITYNSIINKEELDKIEQIVNNISYEKEMH